MDSIRDAAVATWTLFLVAVGIGTIALIIATWIFDRFGNKP